MEHNVVGYAKHYSCGSKKIQEVMNSQEKLITLEEIFLDVGKQMLETNYTLNLGKILNLAPQLNRYLWQKLKPEKTHNVSKTTTKNRLVF
jgi:hypothetical protein